MRFGLLGPVVVERDGSPSDVKSAMPRTVLAVLLLNANTVVSADQLIEAVWGENPPTTATASLHNHVMRLRRFLGEPGGGRIRSVAPGYLIDVGPGELDLEVFAGLCAEGRAAARAGNWAEAARDLAAALALWRGEPVADVPGAVGRDARVLQLVEARLQAREGWVEAELELGRHREVIGELGVLAAEYPLREVFHGQLMLALYRADRQAEALDVFQALRRTLVDELGVEPSASIQELHRQILSADPQLAVPAPAPPPGPAETAAGPAVAARGGWRYQLPADTRVFTGRATELARLIEPAGAVTVSVISGAAGIGKTALAVHAAHRLRERFPDGQLFLDLRGNGADRAPSTPGDALGWLLRSLGVAPSSIPADPDGRSAVFRRRLAETRTLIILDDAAGAEQIRPLLPSGPGSLLLVTSRQPLTGLGDSHTVASALELDELPQADAVALLHKVAGPGRVSDRHQGIAELIALCGNVPLAIRVAAARLRHHRVLRIEDVVAQVREESARPARRPGSGESDPADDRLAAVFESSYAALPPAEQDLFRQLGLIPGPDIDAFAAANLAGTDHRTAERLLESLLDHNLLTQHTPGRYRFHDSVRRHARALAEADSPEDCDAALGRLLHYYLRASIAAGSLLSPRMRALVDDENDSEPLSSYAAAELADRPGALAWLRTEREDLLAVIADGRTGRAACPARGVRLTAALADFLLEEGPWPQAAELFQAAADTARDLGDRRSEAAALYDLGRVRLASGDHPGASAAFEAAAAILREQGYRLGEACAKHQLGRVRLETGEFEQAAVFLAEALAVFEAAGIAVAVADVLNTTGTLLIATAGPKRALPVFQQARRAAREAHNPLAEAEALAGAARCAAALGDSAAALAGLREAVAIHQRHAATGAEAQRAAADLAALERERESGGGSVPVR
ncbi:MAG TPA: BTAD domain-containing putative transcriptional regulator [Actinocrinis sp.]|nr:BTAD domain-containing putative transcriptional regulator [Actinocrinis sp.]